MGSRMDIVRVIAEVLQTTSVTRRNGSYTDSHSMSTLTMPLRLETTLSGIPSSYLNLETIRTAMIRMINRYVCITIQLKIAVHGAVRLGVFSICGNHLGDGTYAANEDTVCPCSIDDAKRTPLRIGHSTSIRAHPRRSVSKRIFTTRLNDECKGAVADSTWPRPHLADPYLP
jgi:hypothetical protein